MQTRFAAVFEPWHIEASPGLLEQLLDDVGFDEIVVPAVGPATSHVCLHDTQRVRLMESSGGWHYPPAQDRYEGLSVRPRAAQWVVRRSAIERIAHALAARGVALVLRLDMLATEAMRALLDQVGVRTAWGEVAPRAGACPLQPAVRELLRRTVLELMDLEPAGIELHRWRVDHHAAAPAWSVVFPAQAGPSALMQICFCEACREVARREDVDADAAARSVRVRVAQALEALPTADSAADHDPVLRGYVTARLREHWRWIAQLRDAVGRERLWTVQDVSLEQAARGAVGASEGDAPGVDAAGANMLESVRVVAADDGSLQRELAADLRLKLPRVAIGCWRPMFDQADQLVRAVAALRSGGAGVIVFEGAADCPASAVRWMHQAVRFARRAAD